MVVVILFVVHWQVSVFCQSTIYCFFVTSSAATVAVPSALGASEAIPD